MMEGSNDTSNLLANLPNLNTLSPKLEDLRNNLCIKMPSISQRKRYQIKDQNLNRKFNNLMNGRNNNNLIDNDNSYPWKCDKCGATFFYKKDLQKHKQYSECIHRPYLCPFCERPFKSCLSVKKHCVNLHSSIINWELVGGLLDFVKQHEQNHDNCNNNNNHNHNHHHNNFTKEVKYKTIVRKFARDFYLMKEQEKAKAKEQQQQQPSFNDA